MTNKLIISIITFLTQVANVYRLTELVSIDSTLTSTTRNVIESKYQNLFQHLRWV